MEEKFLVMKAAITAVITGCGAAFGWRGKLVLVWIAVMLLDYISGSAAAAAAGNWASATARQGLLHKAGMILAVAVSVAADILLMVMFTDYTGWLTPMVLAWYIVTECGSILENAEAMGAPVPDFIRRTLKSVEEKIDAETEVRK